MKITVKMLKKHNACEDQVDLFEATFPDGVQVTEAVCLAVADKFDFSWAADSLPPPEARAEYSAKHAPIWAEYEAKRAPIWAEYWAKLDGIWSEYKAKSDGIRAEYGAKHAPIRAEYEAKRAPIRAEYLAKRAALFGRIAATIQD